MASTVAWLDASSAEQRRVREIVALFTQQESRDELGVGQVRDVLSDLLFPGTSVIQTRARYFLIVPWLFERAREQGVRPSDVTGWVQKEERRLIDTVKRAGVADGLIGRVAGPAVKVLPSAIYWSGLQRWGIVRTGLAPEQVAVRSRLGLFEADELAERQGGPWHPTLPSAPAGFPATCDSLDLTAEEAAWLVERILDRWPDSLLAQLVTSNEPLTPASESPWRDATAVRRAGPARELLLHARLFSLCVHGAALLYNLLVAERYEAAGFTRVTGVVDDYRQRLVAWCADVGTEPALAAWDVEEFWSLVRLANPRISPLTRQFVDSWIEVARGGDPAAVTDDRVVRAAVAERERFQKRAQARLSNDRLLAAWAGASGAAPLTFRWGLVHRIVSDIHAGQGVVDAGA